MPDLPRNSDVKEDAKEEKSRVEFVPLTGPAKTLTSSVCEGGTFQKFK